MPKTAPVESAYDSSKLHPSFNKFLASELMRRLVSYRQGQQNQARTHFPGGQIILLAPDILS